MVCLEVVEFAKRVWCLEAVLAFLPGNPGGDGASWSACFRTKRLALNKCLSDQLVPHISQQPHTCTAFTSLAFIYGPHLLISPAHHWLNMFSK